MPEARGEAQRMIEEANAYKAEVVERSKGQANRFDRLYEEYKVAPEVTRRRLYIEAMEQVYGNSSKVMVDVEGGNNMMYLPIDKILQGNKQSSMLSLPSSSSQQQSKPSSSSSTETVRGLDRLRQSRENRWENR